MDEKFVKKFSILSSIIVVLFAVLLYEFIYFIKLPSFKRKNFLIIGILSAPENFQQRLSIRKTWLQLLPEISASAYFIIGNKLCEVPPYDRADPYSCVNRPFALPENSTDLTEFSTMKIRNVDSQPKTLLPGFIGFGFYIRSSIIVKKIGILKELIVLLKKEIQVKLISAFDKKVLASVTFNPEIINEHTASVVTKYIKPVRLDANFEGFLKLELKDCSNIFFPNCDLALWQNEPNVINYIQLWQEGSIIPQPFNEYSCSFVFMNYTVVGTENIKAQASNRSLRLEEWNGINRKLLFSLKNESNIFHDIFMVDVIDIYRNLSMKLTDFYKRIVDMEHFQYILKADDDSFIDILRVYEHLKEINTNSFYKKGQIEDETLKRLRSSDFWLWSFFKEFWKVEREGKWRENEYPSASYPTFPCGGGYVLNRGIVDFIAENNHLHHFQGEDVSLGIWLSALPVTYYKTPKIKTKDNENEIQKKIINKFKDEQNWEFVKINKTVFEIASNLCEWTCTNVKHYSIPLCNKVQLGITDMYSEWKKYIKRGFL